jgi:hypothetical protein
MSVSRERNWVAFLLAAALLAAAAAQGRASEAAEGPALAAPAATMPTITTAPVPQTVNAGAKATFSVVAAGSPAPTYQWQLNNVDITGATAASFTTAATVPGDDGKMYSVVITNSAGSITSTPVRLTVHFLPSVTTQPAAQSVLLGAKATFTVVGAGNPAPTYQWQRLTPPSTWTNIAGATAASYTTGATLTSDDQAQFRVVLTNSVGPVDSKPAILTVQFAPIIQTPPASQSVTVGFPVTFSVTVIGTAPLSYQWQRQTPPSATWDNVGTAATYTFTPPTIPGNSGSLFQVIVTNAEGSATSTPPATLTVTPPVPPSITAQPISITVVVGHTATFSVGAAGTPTLKYQWFKGMVAIAGATAATYTTPATTFADSGTSYSVAVSNAPETAVTVTSNAAVLTVDAGTSSLPSPWVDADVGTVGSPGDANLAGTTFTVCGAGAGISGTADAFNYLYQVVTGDASIVALVTPASLHSGALAGVMIRETLAPGSAGAGMYITGAGGTLFVDRPSTGAAAAQTAGASATIPYWVRLERSGNTLTGSVSPDGATWTVVKSETVTMAAGVLIGFASTSGDPGALNCSTFDSLSGTGAWAAGVHPSGGGGGGGGCGLLGIEGFLLLLLLRVGWRGGCLAK